MSSESDRHNKGDQPQMVGRFCCVHCRKDEAAYAQKPEKPVGKQVTVKPNRA